MRRYFVSYVIKSFGTPFFGNCIFKTENKFNINEIEKEIAETSLNLIKKENEYLKLKTEDLNPVILFFKELNEDEG